MSEPHTSTGRRELLICGTCGRVVIHAESFGIYLKQAIWMPEHHDAPCGLPCLGGGVSIHVIRSGQVHRKTRCPRCKPAREGDYA